MALAGSVGREGHSLGPEPLELRETSQGGERGARGHIGGNSVVSWQSS